MKTLKYCLPLAFILLLQSQILSQNNTTKLEYTYDLASNRILRLNYS